MALQGYIQVTRACNQDCRFCSNPPNMNELSLEQGRNLVDEFIAKKYQTVIFTGGEPTLSPILHDMIAYTREKRIQSRIITNGQNLADPEYLKSLYAAGLRNINISLYSVRRDVQAFLSGKSDSLDNIFKAVRNIAAYPDVQLIINTVINKYNSDHLSENIGWAIKNAPFVRHFVWNNLDPRNPKVNENRDTVARLNDFQVELHKAVELVLGTNRTCRIERVPLCYMATFEHLSTETRKIVKNEFTSTFFLDRKGLFTQVEFRYGKAACCKVCTLEPICAGLFEMDEFYSSDELYACFVDRESIMRKILDGVQPCAPESAGKGSWPA